MTLRVALYEPLVTVAGWMDAFKSPDEGMTKRSTGAANPFVGTIVMIDVVEVPSFSVMGDGLAVK